MRLSKEAFTTAGLWAENRPKSTASECKMYLADVPLQLQKHNIINSHHLLELEKLFEQILYYSHIDYTCANLYESALKVCPDIFLHHSDEYMASLINNLSTQ